MAALPQDVYILNDIVGLLTPPQTDYTHLIAANNKNMIDLESHLQDKINNLNLPTVRSSKQAYPISPRELKYFFLPENLYILARDAAAASRTEEVRSTDVRNHLRQALKTAYGGMIYRTPRQALERQPGHPRRRGLHAATP